MHALNLRMLNMFDASQTTPTVHKMLTCTSCTQDRQDVLTTARQNVVMLSENAGPPAGMLALDQQPS